MFNKYGNLFSIFSDNFRENEVKNTSKFANIFGESLSSFSRISLETLLKKKEQKYSDF